MLTFVNLITLTIFDFISIVCCFEFTNYFIMVILTTVHFCNRKCTFSVTKTIMRLMINQTHVNILRDLIIVINISNTSEYTGCIVRPVYELIPVLTDTICVYYTS